MTLLRLKAKNVEGQRSHFHRWSMWEPECKAGLAVPNGFSLIMKFFSGLEVGEKRTQICGFAFWIPPQGNNCKQHVLDMRSLGCLLCRASLGICDCRLVSGCWGSPFKNLALLPVLLLSVLADLPVPTPIADHLFWGGGQSGVAHGHEALLEVLFPACCDQPSEQTLLCYHKLLSVAVCV